MYSRSSHERLSLPDLRNFPSDSLHDAIGRVVCEAGCLPRKEFFESWAVAKKVLRRHRGGRVVDLAGGHGLVGWMMALMDRKTTTVVVVDTRLPKSAERLHTALSARWTGLGERITYEQRSLDDVVIASDDRVLGIHACGALTDRVLDAAIGSHARVAVLPCCHSHAKLDDGGLSGWLDADVAIDVVRARRLADSGYVVHTTRIAEDITPKNRLLLGTPQAEPAL